MKDAQPIAPCPTTCSADDAGDSYALPPCGQKISPAALSVAQRLAKETLRPGTVVAALRVVEPLWVLAAALLAAWLVGLVPPDDAVAGALLTGLAGAGLAYFVLDLRRVHDVILLRNGGRSALAGALAVVLAVALTLAGTSAARWMFLAPMALDAGPVPWSGRWDMVWAVLAPGGVVLMRLGLAAVLRRLARRGRLEQRIAVVGGGPEAEALLHSLARLHGQGLHVVGLFDDREQARSPGIVAGVHKLGTTDDLLAFARVARIDMLIVSLPLSAEARILQLLRKLWVLPVDIRLSVHNTRLRFRPRTYSWLGPIPFLDVFDRPLRVRDRVLKRGFDLVVGSILLLLALPLMALIALAVRLEGAGPVLFRQQRHGFNNRPIEVLKFRTLHAGQSDPLARRPVTRNDPRVSRVGRWLRRSSLDELPQLINVLRGDLSLVGPRPHVLAARSRDWLFAEVVEGYFARHRVKPGITGWAQINGWRGEIDSDEKLQARISHDLHYIDRWSLWFDLKILALTPLALLRDKNAF